MATDGKRHARVPEPDAGGGRKPHTERCTGCGRLLPAPDLVAIGDDLLCAECRMEAEGCGCED